MQAKKISFFISNGLHGFDGELVIAPLYGILFTQEEMFKILESDIKIHNEDGLEVKIHFDGGVKKNGYIARIDGIENREDANKTLKQLFFVELQDVLNIINHDATTPHEIEYINCKIIDNTNNDICGYITNVLNYGAGDILEITLQNDHTEKKDKKILLIPLIDDYVYGIDIKNQVVSANLMDFLD